jgi:hypothetical protein
MSTPWFCVSRDYLSTRSGTLPQVRRFSFTTGAYFGTPQGPNAVAFSSDFSESACSRLGRTKVRHWTVVRITGAGPELIQ